MSLCSWLLSSVLVSQIGGNPSVPVTVAPGTANPRESAVPAATYPGNPADGGGLVREPAAVPAGVVQPPATPLRATTTQLVYDALILPPGSSISGQPVSLVSVVATVSERQRQIEAVHAYWRLAEAVGEYHFSHERQQRLARLQAGNDEATDLRTARAVAAAQIREAELQVTTAQHDLAEILLLTPGTPLPLPANQPLVGPYRTLFAELFAGKKAPERARMLDQMLPLRNRAVEGHAAALLASEDALDAAIELQSSGQGRVAAVIAALDTEVRQQQAFLAAVCRYNHDIADYALVVVSPRTTPDLLVGTLIKLNRPAGQPVVPLPTTAVPVFGSAGISPAILNLPTPAVRPSRIAGQALEAVTAVRAEETTSADLPSVITPPNPLRSNELEEPRLAPPQESAIPLVPDKPAGSAAPPSSTKSTEGPVPHTSRKPIGASSTSQARSGEQGAGSPIAVKLTAAWYGAPRSPLPTLRLIDCVRTAPAKSRVNVVDAYWTVRQTAAQYQGLVEQLQWLEALKPTLSTQNPPSPMAMVKFRAARLAVEADRADAEADWTMAKLQLIESASLGSEKTMPQLVTVPFVGRLPLSASSSDRPWSQRRLEATIPRRELTIIDQATVVFEADASRVTATADFLAGRASVERVLAGIEVQARETSAFLRGVTAYNRAIAHYETAILPANTEAEKLVAALMVE